MFKHHRYPYNTECWDPSENQKILAFDTQLELTRNYFFGWSSALLIDGDFSQGDELW